MIYILLSAAIVTALMQHWTDTSVILCVIFINAIIGFMQENKAEKELAAIRGLLTVSANVLRDGQQHMIAAEDLVLGDVVILSAGDKVPADLRLISAHSLRTQEAILTGESLDVEKSNLPVSTDAALGERHCMAYSGTLVTAGQGKGIVVATGEHTEIGRIGSLIGKVEAPDTPFSFKLTRLSKWLAVFILSVSLSILVFGIFVRHLPASDMFMVMIGIAVSSIPEGLPAVISITMALGARAMARRNGIVRHLPAIETLGSVTVICTDKTGTLTRNELAVTDIITTGHSFGATGVGYSPAGDILSDEKEIILAEHPIIFDIGHAALLNNDATLQFKKGVWELNGDPTEGALMAFALKAGHDSQIARKLWPRIDLLPFSAETRYMATLHHQGEKGIIYIKGAPETLLPMCNTQQDKDGKDVSLDAIYWNKQIIALAGQGKRVLAVARRHVPTSKQKLHVDDITAGLTLLGLFGIMDAPREEAKKSIATCLAAGIKVKMITGDHALTASAVGKLLGIPNSGQVMTGGDIDRLSGNELTEAAKDINIYARMHPEHKLKLVQALQTNGNVVAMTGDGVNDAPALKSADIGIAMGKQGTEVAKEAADLVLADDNFTSIIHAVEEGRNIYRNIRRTIQFMLVTDGAEGMVLLIAVLAGFTLPITPLQILWVNMVTAVTLSLAFAFAPHDPSVMDKLPLPVNGPIFPKRSIISFLRHGALMAFGTICLFLYTYSVSGEIDTARTTAINTLVFFQIYYLLAFFPALRSGGMSRLNHYMPVILAGGGVVLLQLILTYVPWMQAVFKTYPLGFQDWIGVTFMSGSILLWLWVERYFAAAAKGVPSI